MVSIIVDTSVILAGFPLDGQDEYYSTPLVIEEIQRGKKKEHINSLLESDRIKIKTPSDSSISEVRSAASDTGDLSSLSDADISLLALAYELKGVLLTDDYACQNTARKMGVEYRGYGKSEIRTGIEWSYRCAGCGKWFDVVQPDCPICGSEVKRKKKR